MSASTLFLLLFRSHTTNFWTLVMAQKDTRNLSSQNKKNYEVKFFYEDEVYRWTSKGQLQYGMVVDNAEFCSSDEDEDDEDEQLKKGFVRVAWHPVGNEEVIKESKVNLLDRSLMPGDVVRKFIEGRDTQRGYCRNVDVFSNCEIVGTDAVVYGINSKELEPLQEFVVDVAVCLGPWVGMVKNVKSKITCSFRDGSVCVLEDFIAQDLEDVTDSRDEDSEFRRFEFFPNQILSGPLKTFDQGQWQNRTDQMAKLIKEKPTKKVKGMVTGIKVHSLLVQWQCRAGSQDDEFSYVEEPHPKFVITGEDLKRVKMLNVFEPSTLQIGDRNFYTIKESDIILPRKQWKKLEIDTLRQTHGTKMGSIHLKKSSAASASSAKVSTEEPKVSIVPNDNSTKRGTESSEYEDVDSDDEDNSDCSSVVSAGSLSKRFSNAKKKGASLATRMLQKKKKLKKSQGKMVELPNVILARPGDKVVVETLCTKSEANVVWQDGNFEEHIASHNLYPIHHLDEHEFFPGDFVVRNETEPFNPRTYGVVQNVDHSGRTCRVSWFKTYTNVTDRKPEHHGETEEPVYDLKDHPLFKFRPGSIVVPVMEMNEGEQVEGGQVLDNFPSGKVGVRWGSGLEAQVWPQELFKVGEYDSDEGELWEASDSDESWETESEHSVEEEVPVEEEDGANLWPKLAANIEKARIAMARLEEIFNANPVLQTRITMKQLLDVYKDCRYLDRLMGTSFFHEDNFEGLLERVKERDRISDRKQARDEQVSQLFSPDVETVPPMTVTSPTPSHPSSHDFLEPNSALRSSCKSSFDSSSKTSSIEVHGLSPNRDSGNETLGSAEYLHENLRAVDWSIVSPTAEDDGSKAARFTSNQQICARICSLIKGQLVKSHEEVLRRFGGQTAAFTQDDLAQSPGEDEADLAGIMYQILSATRDNLSSVANGVQPGPQKEASKDGNCFKMKSEVSAHDLSTALYGACQIFKSKEDPPKEEEEENPKAKTETGKLSMEASAPATHQFKLALFQPTEPKNFLKFVRKEIKLLESSLPPGIFVKCFEDRMDLYSVMIKGPERTPYEDGLFFFDFQLSQNYPQTPPLCHYISYCSDRLNPNLYEDGKVCVSLLGTWSGKGTETWSPNSNMLQLLVSIQGLILVSEPYFNEAGYERQKGTQQGLENSRMYNEMVLLKLVQSMTLLLRSPPGIFSEEIKDHFKENSERFINRLKNWRRISMQHCGVRSTPDQSQDESKTMPEFPLIPASRGFCISLEKAINAFQDALGSTTLLSQE